VNVVIGPIRLPNTRANLLVEDFNPGIGGTEFMAVQVARYLGRMAPEHEILLWVPEDSLRLSQPEGRPTIVSSVANVPIDVLISPSYEAHSNPTWAHDVEARVRIVWSHLPHDPYLTPDVLGMTDGLVCVGHYARNSNYIPSLPTFKIRNPFVPYLDWSAVLEKANGLSEVMPLQPITDPLIGFVGALHPAKGFHHIASQWQEVAHRLPGARLLVIGAASLYGDSDEHPLIPTSMEYGNRIMRSFGSSDVPKGVTFLGRIDSGLDALLMTLDLGLVNPTGSSEADPASVKNFFRLGIPVVGGLGLGQTELLSNLPGPALRDISSLGFVLEELLRDRPLLQARALVGLNRAAQLAIASASELALWKQIIESNNLRKLEFQAQRIPSVDDWGAESRKSCLMLDRPGFAKLRRRFSAAVSGRTQTPN
jgi:hypothetical protein